MAKLLYNCTFLPGSWDKRFVGAMWATADSSPEKELTPKQAENLDRVFFKYRKQIGNADNMVKDLKKQIPPAFEVNNGKLF